MFDIEKAKKNGIDEKSIKIMESVNENSKKEERCTLHEFEPGSRLGEHICKNCGCKENTAFILGYKRGLEHARRQQDGIERR